MSTSAQVHQLILQFNLPEVLMTTTEQRPSSGYKVVGTRPIRHDGIDKVTGAAKYGADIQLAGMLHGKVLAQSVCARSNPVY